ncbi:ETHYLENE INSENSITIVE 3-like [Asimina triloba]
MTHKKMVIINKDAGEDIRRYEDDRDNEADQEDMDVHELEKRTWRNEFRLRKLKKWEAKRSDAAAILQEQYCAHQRKMSRAQDGTSEEGVDGPRWRRQVHAQD